MIETLLREGLRREKVPPRILWWLAADGMNGWYGMLERGLAEPLGGREKARAVVAEIASTALHRRWDRLRQRHDWLPDRTREPRSVGLLMGGLYRLHVRRGPAWVLSRVGGAPTSALDRVRAEALLVRLDSRQRWNEVATHLGTVLIALTEELPAKLPGANAALGKLCFEGGAKYGARAKKTFGLPDSPDSAIEVLRLSEFIFQVNPQHWHATDPAASTGYLEGTACPWFTSPGWSMMHCGIFGQFQSGIASAFGLRYQLTSTIPKHGGTTCRIDLKPIQLRRKDAASVS